jgi:hypothetical protein
VKRLVILVPLLLFASLVPQAAVRACSAPPTTLEEEVAQSDIIVKARAVEFDETQQTYIAHVETYLKGEPTDEFILVTSHTYIEALRSPYEFYGYGDCDHFVNVPIPGEPVYLFLIRHPTGVFSLATVSPYIDFDYPVWVGLDDESVFETQPSHPITENQFVDLVAEIVGTPPHSPSGNSRYPVHAPILITMSDGRRYVMPVNLNKVFELDSESLASLHVNDRVAEIAEALGCPDLSCIVFSSNLVDFAYQHRDRVGVNGVDEVPGQAFVFSGTGDSLAVWNEQRLTIYHFQYFYHPPVVASITLDGGAALFAGRGAWSPDGRWFAFSDAVGLWLWNISHLGTLPELALAAEDDLIPYARYFSPEGHYLAISTGEVHETLELDTGRRLPDGLVSPNDHWLLAFDTSAPESELSLCALYVTNVTMPCGRYENATVSQLAWRDEDNFLAIVCTPDNCGFAQTPADEDVGYLSTGGWPGLMFDYDPSSDHLLVLWDAHTIRLSRRRVEPGFEVFDLSTWIDGDIISVEWLPSYFYRAS